MADFNLAIPVVLGFEGGFVDNPHDPGGVTNFGITIKFLTDATCLKYFGHAGPATRDDIIHLTKEQASQIYLDQVWNKNKYGTINDNQVACKLFDSAVNIGEYHSTLIAQESLKILGLNVVADGLIGPSTIAAINSENPLAFLKKFCELLAKRYNDIVQIRPDSAVFLKGWLRRAAWPFN